MTHNLHIRWNDLVDPQGHSECLADVLEDLKPDFRSVSYFRPDDTKQPKQRWWQSAPAISEVGKAFESDIPTWKIGYTIKHDSPAFYAYDEIVPPVSGSVFLIFSVPDYKRYLVQNQSALEHMFGHRPHEFEGLDSERVEKATRLLHEALYRIGLHPEGPNPPDDSNWSIGL